MKKMCCILLPMLMAPTLQASTVTANNGTASVSANLAMTIATDNCTISNSSSIRTNVVFDDISVEDLRQHTTFTEDIPLEITCSPGATAALISVSPAPGYQLVTDGSDGRVTTDLAGVGLAVYWQSTVSEVNMSPGFNTRFNYRGQPINASLLVKPVAINANISPGDYHSAIVVAVTYI